MVRYEKYKESGVYYIPEIPQSWSIFKAKWLFKEEKRPVRKEDDIVTCFRDGQVTLRKNRRTEGFTNATQENGYQGIRKGDLVIHNMDAFAGAIGVSDSDGKSTPVYAVCTPIKEGINPFFYAYLLRNLAYSGFILSLAKGIRERSTDFRFADFRELYLPVPPVEDQNAMVSFIDTCFDEIDKAIAQQQRMIDLLNERKQIIIQNAVTKGLNPNAPMKESGIEWIGKIPAHWELKHLRNFLTLFSEKGYPNATLLSVTREQGVIMRSYDIEENHNFIPDDLSGYKHVCIGDFVINKMKSWQGSYGLSDYDGIVSPAYFTCKLNNIGNKLFFSTAIRCKAYTHFFMQYSKGIRIGQWDLDPDSMKAIPFILPPEEEQQPILDYISDKTAQIAKGIAACEKNIELFQERKRIIINDVVTGKIKVS
ncbi:MAG: restriction endonuclease subunit S [Bacteroidales bacterium]|nr:restriction endonuclease subunit S [Bacteroidales bacterium]